METELLLAEIAANFDYFQRTLPEHLRAHAGEYVLLKQTRVHGYFASVGDADREGWTRFPDHLYSIQEVTPEPVELGVYANAGD